MKNLKIVIAAVVLIVGYSLVLGLLAMCGAWLISGTRLDIYDLSVVFRLSVFVCILGLCILWLAHGVRKGIVNYRVSHIMETDGATMEIYALLTNRVDKARGAKARAMAQLSLASYLTEGGHYKECYQVLSQIDVEDLSPFYQDEYYNVQLYARLLDGDIDGADEILSNASFNFERASQREHNMPVLHTLGVYQYAKGNFSQAEELLTKAALNAPTKQAKADCFLYLGLCYLKTGRKEYAKAAAIEASGQVRTIYQKENLKKLMKLVEKAYGYGV